MSSITDATDPQPNGESPVKGKRSLPTRVSSGSEALGGAGDTSWSGDFSLDEPQLEFDEFDMEFAAQQELAKEEDLGMAVPRSGAITPDGLIDDDFEAELGSQSEVKEEDMPFYDVAKHRILEIAGDDSYGRKVIVFAACRLPPSKEIDHERLKLYLRHTLDQYVENDYSIVYFHYGLHSHNKPTFKWLREAYREFDRKYKKNLKALYVVHPTTFIKVLWTIFKPLISAKFGRKVMYVNYLQELEKHIHIDQINIPERVIEHDALMQEKHKPRVRYVSVDKPTLDTQQFGVTLDFIKQQSGQNIPPLVVRSVEYLKEHGLEVEGIFRRTANATRLKEVQKMFNEGQAVDFGQVGDIHIPAVILKTFLRELQQPIMTFDLYPSIMKIHTLSKDEQIVETQRILLTELPEINYEVLKYIIEFLTWVAAKSDVNKMTAPNLAIVFGPNLVWSRTQASISSMAQINSFAKLLIDHYEELFTKESEES